MTVLKIINEEINRFLNNQIPTKRINKVYHVGDINITNKSTSSYEGSGLSVSLHPEEWQRIARMSSDEVHVLTKQNGTFADAHKITPEQKNEIIVWGVENEYVIQGETYRVYFMDDNGDEAYMEFPTREEADYEADGENEVRVNSGGIKPTDKLKQETKQSRIEPSQTFDLLLTIFLENNTNYDGVWWDDMLDVSSLSAPRGVIFNKKINDWLIDG